MNKYFLLLGYVFLLSSCASSIGSNSNNGGWHNVRQNAVRLEIKDIEGNGMDFDYTGKNIGLADAVIAAFTTSGPTLRTTPINIQGPIIRLNGAKITPLDKGINELIHKAISVNADPSTIDSQQWQKIKAKYPSITHVVTTIFQISEEWRDSSQGHYLWSSYVIARTIIIDVNTLQIVSEWRQEVQDRSTWERSPEAPERLVFYLKPVETIQRNIKGQEHKEGQRGRSFPFD